MRELSWLGSLAPTNPLTHPTKYSLTTPYYQSENTMELEIERKFEVVSDDWRAEVDQSLLIQQGYLLAEKNKTVRVRICAPLTGDGSVAPEAFLTIKMGNTPITTEEFEYEIPYDDAVQLMRHSGDLTLEKIRHHVRFDGRVWEVDEFQGRHEGLIVAEIECKDAMEINNFPDWVGREVTYDSYFKNASLVQSSTTIGPR
jgi:adenylate cyclase